MNDSARPASDDQWAAMLTLLARGGWELVDPRPTAAEHPDTFQVPTDDELSALGPGDVVRAMYRVATIADVARDGLSPWAPDGTPNLTSQVERMWGVVISADADDLAVELTNLPFGTHTSLVAGDKIEMPRSHVISIAEPVTDFPEWEKTAAARPTLTETDPVAPTATPRMTQDQQAVVEQAGVERPEPPSPFAVALVAKDLTADSELIHGARFDARHEGNDSGWMFFAGDVDMEEVAAGVGFAVMPLAELHSLCPRVWPYVALPTDWGFSMDLTEDEVYELTFSD